MLSPDVDTDESRLTENSSAGVVRVAAVVDVLTVFSELCRGAVDVLALTHRQPGTIQSHVPHTPYRQTRQRKPNSSFRRRCSCRHKRCYCLQREMSKTAQNQNGARDVENDPCVKTPYRNTFDVFKHSFPIYKIKVERSVTKQTYGRTT